MQADLNADLGESYGRWVLGDDAAMLRHVSSANVACGFHAGDPLTLQRACAGAAEHGVVIGAQVGYPDLMGFGRRFVDIAPDELTAAVIYQIGALDGLARAAGRRVRYLKPHGALYNAVVEHETQARAVVDAVLAIDPELPVLGLPGSAMLRVAAERGLRVVAEGFADRAYTPEGHLVDRRTPGAVLDDVHEIARRSVRMLTQRRVTAIDGTDVGLEIESLCLHGDSPGAVASAGAVRRALDDASVEVSSFVSP